MTQLTLGEEAPTPPSKIFIQGLLSYYAPYLLAVFLCIFFILTALFPARWWVWLVCQLIIVSIVYRITLRREHAAEMVLPAIVVCSLGQLHFLVLNGMLMRALNAAVISFGIAAHVRGMIRTYVLPAQFVSSYRLFIAMFLASLSVYTSMAIAGAAVMLLQFSIGGAAGAVFLVTLLMTGQVMELTSHPPAVKRRAGWLFAFMITELATVLLFLPTLPFVAAAMVLSIYAPLLELARVSFALPARRVLWWGGGGIAALWIAVLATARWP